MTKSTTPEVDLDKLKEKLADIEHQRWADWQKWCHKILRANIDHDIEPTLAHWERQIATPYSELSRPEQLSDLEQVDRYWPLIESYISKLLEKQDIKSRIAELKKVRETAHHYYIDPEAFYKPPHLLIDDRINELNSLSQSPVNTDGEKR